MKSTGVNINCPVNYIKSYHHTDNFLFFMMHHLLEGMLVVLSHFVEEHYISLESVNLEIDVIERIQFSNLSLHQRTALKNYECSLLRQETKGVSDRMWERASCSQIPWSCCEELSHFPAAHRVHTSLTYQNV